jgi:hypothetical protein
MKLDDQIREQFRKQGAKLTRITNFRFFPPSCWDGMTTRLYDQQLS